jgi:2-aminomuconate deaminase
MSSRALCHNVSFYQSHYSGRPSQSARQLSSWPNRRRPDNSHDGVIFHDDGRVELDIEAQTKAVIENMRLYLQAAGADLEHLVDLTTFLVSMEHFAGYNRVYNTYFNAETGPTRTTVAVHQLPHPNLLIEIKGIARLP